MAEKNTDDDKFDQNFGNFDDMTKNTENLQILLILGKILPF